MKFWVIFSAVCLFFALEAKPLSVPISAPAAILMNSETGAILYGKEIHEKHFPASVTKIATALYVLEKNAEALDTIVEASHDALMMVLPSIRQQKGSNHPSYRLETDGTSARIYKGERLSLLALLYAAMLQSGNDAANVLAEAMCGTIDRFMVELNLFLKKQGLANTQFTNPHGLHDPNHWTTAYDMAQLTRVALKNRLFCEIVRAKGYSHQTGKNPRVFPQKNRLLKQGLHYYPKAIGVKIGYTSDAGSTFVAAAAHEGRVLIAVLFKCPKGGNQFRDAIKLFDAAFAEKKVMRMLYAQESDRFMHSIKGAKVGLEAVLKEDVILEYYPAEEPSFRAEIVWGQNSLPIGVGDCVGRLRCVDAQGNILIEKSLVASKVVSKQRVAVIFDFCKEQRRVLLGAVLAGLVVLFLFYFFKKSQKVGKR